MGENVVRNYQVGPPVTLGDLTASLGSQELDYRRNALRQGYLSHVGGRLDTEHGDPQRQKVLQEIAVVARHFNDEAVRSEIQSADYRLYVPLRVRHPRVGVRREIRVVGVNLLPGHIGRKLDEQAGAALTHMQRVEDLRLIEPLGGHIALTQGGHPEI